MPMPFKPQGLSDALQEDLADFAGRESFAALFRRYNWRNDTWSRGFPDMLDLELRLRESARRNTFTRDDVERVQKWGGLPRAVTCADELAVRLTVDGEPDPQLESDPCAPVRDLQPRIKGFGPTFVSKLLLFAVPEEYGAIDSRLVRIFGEGDSDSRVRDWLRLKVRESKGRWAIPPSQRAWPDEFATWTNILRWFVRHLNENGPECPHTEGFVRAELRERGKWLCADVETALYAYTSDVLD